MEFSKQEYWSGCCFLLQGILPVQGSEPASLHLLHGQSDSSLLCHLGSRLKVHNLNLLSFSPQDCSSSPSTQNVLPHFIEVPSPEVSFLRDAFLWLFSLNSTSDHHPLPLTITFMYKVTSHVWYLSSLSIHPSFTPVHLSLSLLFTCYPSGGLSSFELMAIVGLFKFIYIFGCSRLLAAAHRLTLVMASRDYSLAAVHGFALRRLLLWWRTGSRAQRGFRSCGSRAQKHRLSSCGAEVSLCGHVIFPGQGLNPHPLHWQADASSPGHQESPVVVCLPSQR